MYVCQEFALNFTYFFINLICGVVCGIKSLQKVGECAEESGQRFWGVHSVYACMYGGDYLWWWH